MKNSSLSQKILCKVAKGENDKVSSLLLLKALSGLVLLFFQFNDTSPERSNVPEKVINTKFLDIN